MNTLMLQKVEKELRTASQSLWEFRQKHGATIELANFLMPFQERLAFLIQDLAETREFLAAREDE